MPYSSEVWGVIYLHNYHYIFLFYLSNFHKALWGSLCEEVSILSCWQLLVPQVWSLNYITLYASRDHQIRELT